MPCIRCRLQGILYFVSFVTIDVRSAGCSQCRMFAVPDERDNSTSNNSVNNTQGFFAMNNLRCGILLMCGLTFAAGCSAPTEDRLPTFPVTGKVTQGGAPVAGAIVTFSPLSSGTPAALGRTDAQGVYELTTYEQADGAVAGEYKVMVSKASASASSGPEIGHDPTGAAGPTGPPTGHGSRSGGSSQSGSSLLPEKYASASETPLSKVVEEKQDNVYDIEL